MCVCVFDQVKAVVTVDKKKKKRKAKKGRPEDSDSGVEVSSREEETTTTKVTPAGICQEESERNFGEPILFFRTLEMFRYYFFLSGS